MQFNRHPTSLWVLCLTETWERYGFYAIQSLIALFLSQQLGLVDSKAYLLVGAFTALTYISPILGGWIADHLLGQRQSVILGAVVLFASYLGLAFNHNLQGIIYSLSMVALGTGLLKPNISALLGRQYPIGDPKRNTGFTLFYMGINLGILLGTTIPAQIQLLYGWPLCFLSASFGLLIALFIFIIGCRYYPIENYADLNNTLTKTNRYAYTGLILLTFYWICYLVFNYTTLATLFFTSIVFVAVGYVSWTAYTETGLQRIKTTAFFLLCLISTIFWSLYFQMFMVLTFFISRTVSPTLFGVVFPTTYYIAAQSIGILVFGSILQYYWSKQSVTNMALSVSIKFSMSILLMMAAYGTILLSIGNTHSSAVISPIPIIGAFLLISLAELLLSPIGLAAVTDLIRPQIVSTMMGIFFVTLGLGGYIAGKLAVIASIDHSIQDIVVIKTTYHMAFVKLTSLLFVAFILSLLVVFMIRGLFVRYAKLSTNTLCTDAGSL